MTYVTSVEIPAWKYQRINQLLSLPDFKEMTDKELRDVGAREDSVEGVFGVKFKDGSTFTYDLCSGNSNYFDDMIFCDSHGIASELECDYELGDEIEFENEGNTYVIHIIVDWSKP